MIPGSRFYFVRAASIAVAAAAFLAISSAAAPAARPLPRAPQAGTARPALPNHPPAGDRIMKVEEVRAGMKGYGLTVWRGAKIEPFEVEVLGVLPKINLGQPLVLVRLSGGPISERGAYLVQGMSGSPIYIDGKLLGAFSQGDAWPKEPIGMVTPIEGMLEALDPKLSRVPAGGDHAFDWNAPVASPAAGGLFRAPEQQSIEAAGRTIRPLALPVMVSGLGRSGVEEVAQALRPFNMAVMQGPGSLGQKFKADLVPGAALGISLVTGDVDITSIGTVTYRKGDDLLAFGHPWMQIGAAEWPITTAWIHDVFPGFQISHKYGSAGEIVGTLTQDRPYSVAGRVGPKPKMVPVHYTVSDRTTGRRKSFNCEVVNHPLLIGRFIPIAVNAGLYEVRPVPGDATARVKMTVETEGAGTLKRENVFFDPAAIDIAAVRELQELMGLLGSNDFKRVPIRSVDLEVEYEERRPTATIERIFLDQSKFEPGDEVDLGIVLRPYRRDPVILKQPVVIPRSAGSGRALLLVHGGTLRINLGALLGGAPAAPGLPGGASATSLRQAVREFTDRERNDHVVSRLIFPTTAPSIEGARLSGLPEHLAEVMRSARSTGLRIERDETRSMLDSAYIVQGMQTLAITIERKDVSEKPGGASAGPSSAAPAGSLFGPSAGASRRTLSDDEADYEGDDEELSFTVDGRPLSIRLAQAPVRMSEDAAPAPGKAEPAAPKEPAATKPDAKPGSAAPPEASAAATKPDAVKLVGRAARTWTQSSRADFERGTFKASAVNSGGEVRMTPQLSLVAETDEQFVWCVASGKDAVYAGTGNGGRILRIAEDGAATTFWDSEESAIHALVRDSSGNLYAGSSPNGAIYRITPEGKATELFSMRGDRTEPASPGRFVLALALDPAGALYASIGPEGELYRIPAAGGAARRLATLPGAAITSLLVNDGMLYLGCAVEGSIYRLNLKEAEAAPEVLCTTGQKAVTGLCAAPGGILYAATAPAGRIYRIDPRGKADIYYDHGRSGLMGLLIDKAGNLYTGSGDALLRIESDGSATLLRDERKAQFTCLTWTPDGRITAGSSNVGALYRLASARNGTFESTVHDAGLPARWGRIRFTATLPPGGVLKVQTRSGNVPQPDSTWSGWANLTTIETSQYVSSPPARYLQYRVELQADSGSPALRELTVYYLPLNRAPRLTLAVPHGGEIWNGTQSLKWSAADPDSDTLTYELTYSSDGGRTWKPVGAAGKDSAPAAPAAKPQAAMTREQRAEEALEQYRQHLEKDAGSSSDEKAASLARARALVQEYLKENPEEDEKPEADSPPAPAAGGAASSGSPSRPPGVTRSATMSWDTSKVPDGIYRIKIRVTDAASNPGEELTDEKITEPFIVTNTAPEVFLLTRGAAPDGDGKVTLSGFSLGRVSLKGAQYRVAGGDWFGIRSDDGLWDGSLENFRFTVQLPARGKQKIEVKVVDFAGNVASASAEIEWK